MQIVVKCKCNSCKQEQLDNAEIVVDSQFWMNAVMLFRICPKWTKDTATKTVYDLMMAGF